MTILADRTTVNAGSTVKISVSATDMSPASPLTPAKNLPVTLLYRTSTGAEGTIATVQTDNTGGFSTSWTPTSTGTYTIIASSPGSGAYEKPADVTTTIVATSGAAIGTVGAIGIVIALTLSTTAITLPIRKRKQEGGKLYEA
jgi:hypothetical protein